MDSGQWTVDGGQWRGGSAYAEARNLDCSEWDCFAALAMTSKRKLRCAGNDRASQVSLRGAFFATKQSRAWPRRGLLRCARNDSFGGREERFGAVELFAMEVSVGGKSAGAVESGAMTLKYELAYMPGQEWALVHPRGRNQYE